MGAMNHSLCNTAAFDSKRLEHVFERCFLAQEHTRLVGGAQEPFYQPAATPGTPHLLYYREDYFASALHEVSHWCIAGRQRRQLPDFGYWYAPEGRNPEQQRAFEAVEVKPQALEWYFSQACGFPFRVSVDNLDPLTGALPDTRDFRRRLARQARQWQITALPVRAERFFRALVVEFGHQLGPSDAVFQPDLID